MSNISSLAGTFGITKDLTSSYMIVMKYYENGNLYQYLDHCNGILSWRDITAGGLERIHSEGKIHGNLHGGNLLIEDERCSYCRSRFTIYKKNKKKEENCHVTKAPMHDVILRFKIREI